MHFVDLGESFPTHIYLQNLALIQPITIPVKFARSPRIITDPPGVREIRGHDIQAEGCVRADRRVGLGVQRLYLRGREGYAANTSPMIWLFFSSLQFCGAKVCKSFTI